MNNIRALASTRELFWYHTCVYARARARVCVCVCVCVIIPRRLTCLLSLLPAHHRHCVCFRNCCLPCQQGVGGLINGRLVKEAKTLFASRRQSRLDKDHHRRKRQHQPLHAHTTT